MVILRGFPEIFSLEKVPAPPYQIGDSAEDDSRRKYGNAANFHEKDHRRHRSVGSSSENRRGPQESEKIRRQGEKMGEEASSHGSYEKGGPHHSRASSGSHGDTRSERFPEPLKKHIFSLAVKVERKMLLPGTADGTSRKKIDQENEKSSRTGP